MARRKRRGNGEGTVYQRADGLWTAQLTVGHDPATGRPIRKTVYDQTQRGCVEKLDTLKSEAREGILSDTTTMTVWRCLDLWLTGQKAQVSEGSYVAYTRRVGKLRPYTEHLPLSRLNGLAVAGIYRDMERDGVSASDRYASGKLLRQALKWAVNLDFIRHNAALKIPLPRVTRKEIHPLDEGQARSLVRATENERLHALYVVALDSGAREGELWALTWADWDAAANVLSITKTLSMGIGGEIKVKTTKTKKSLRNVPLGELSRAALQAHRVKMAAEGHGSSYIFPGRDGTHLPAGWWLRYHWPRAVKEAGLPPATRFHDLRHTCATLLLKAGVNVKVVSERLGHSSVVITLNTYAHVMPGMQKEATRIMAGLLTGPDCSTDAVEGPKSA